MLSSTRSRWVDALVVMAVAAVLAALVVVRLSDDASRPGAVFSSGQVVPPVTPRQDASEDDGIRLVQANIKSGMSPTATAQDIGRVYAQSPDFITFNEVSGRPDSVLVPSGYALQRTPGTYKGATPVAWDSTKWTRLDSGTYMITETWGKTAKQKVHWGVRYANWVTVRDAKGRTVSVVSVHFAPASKYTTGLTGPSYDRLGKLAKRLSASGPVLMAGDVNVNFRTGAYPRTQVAELGLSNAFDLAGYSLGTHRSGAVIDHVYTYAADSLLPLTNLTTVPGNSDHHLVVADLGPVGQRSGIFSPGRVNSAGTDPATTRLLRRSIKKAPAGAVLHLAAKKLEGGNIVKLVKKARARGVHVQVITGHRSETRTDRRLAKILGTKKKKKSWARRQPNWNSYALPRGLVLASETGGTRALRIDFNRAWIPAKQKSARAFAQVRSDKFSYDRMFVEYFRAVGKKI